MQEAFRAMSFSDENLCPFSRYRIPESPRYYLVKGDIDKAESILARVARSNGVSLPCGRLRPLDAIPERGYDDGSVVRVHQIGVIIAPFLPVDLIFSSVCSRFRDLIARPLRSQSILLWIFWFCLVFAYYGVTIWLPSYLTLKSLDLNLFVSFILIGVAEIPGVLLAAFIVDRIGRKRVLAASMLGSSIMTVAFSFASTKVSFAAVSMVQYFFVVMSWVRKHRIFVVFLSSLVVGCFIGIYSPITIQQKCPQSVDLAPRLS